MAFGKTLIILVVAAVSLLFIHAADAQLGAMTEIEDVEHNKEVQDLGKYSVDEYNKKLGGGAASKNMLLAFVEVVAAEKQIVSGTKYYLKIAATEKGVKKMFESQVVVKPWMKKAPKTMLGFRRYTGN
ncbi:hypothetical protein QQ045_031352 [Rhodiola kirilowii]